eukprot:scaffold5692_cov74-Phaeocystis_antarctica.AAC.4
MKAEGRPRVRLARTVHGKGLSHLRVSTCAVGPPKTRRVKRLSTSRATPKRRATQVHGTVIQFY